MSLWAVLVTGLFAGGVSCAVVQGGLLAGAVARQRGPEATPAGPRSSERRQAAGATPLRAQAAEDLLPVAGFLGGKLASHALLGAILGLIGEAAQLGFRARALMQIVAGLLMLIMALDLLGVKSVRRLIPRTPARLGRLLRRSGRSRSALMPAVLGFSTVLIPCGVTLSMGFLAVSSGSALAGSLIMATFVIGTSPLFAALGYAARRSAKVLRGRVGKLAAIAVMVVGLFTINTGLVLSGSPLTFGSVREAFAQARTDLVRDAGGEAPIEPAGGRATTRVVDGVQVITIDALSDGYEPSRLQAKAGIPTRLTVRTNGTQGCTRSFVVPSLGKQDILPETGDTDLELGALAKGDLQFTCAMGMYTGVIEVN